MNETHTSVGARVRLLIGGSTKSSSSRSFQWIFYLVSSSYFGAVFLRSILVYQDSPDLTRVLGLLLVWLALFITEPAIGKRWSGYFFTYLITQMVLIFILLGTEGYPDFMAALFAILSMQVMLQLAIKPGAAWLVLWGLGMAWIMARVYGSQTIALVLIYTAGNVFYGAYSRATRRAQEAQAHNRTLAAELGVANEKLKTYSAQLEQLAMARERSRLARDLHDSVTQTVFSMTLTTQSALLLLEKDGARVAAQLERLSQLARNALAEMQLLITELKPEDTTGGGLAATLGKYLADDRFPESLSISLEVEEGQALGPEEEQGLFHIVQEALNNIVKHTEASKAQVRLHLSEPLWIEVEDWGQGFELQQAQRPGRVGLSSMSERAAEIGWDLQIQTSPGHGTCIRVAKLPEKMRQI